MQISLTDEVTRQCRTPGLAIRGGFGLALALLAVSAQAAYTVTVAQSGADVIANGSGTINLAALTYSGSNSQRAVVYPLGGFLQTGPVAWVMSDFYDGLTTPPIFGPGQAAMLANSGTGALVGIQAAGLGAIYLPTGYVSGSSLTSSATWNNQTIAGMGMTPGTYTWTWGSGGTADSFTLIIQGAAPTLAATDDTYSGLLNHGLAVGAPGVLGNDTPSSGLTVSSWGTPGHGTLTSTAADGSFQYTPNTGWYGTDTFTYTASDGTQTSAATVSIVIPQGTPPAITSAALPDGTIGVSYAFTVTATGSPTPTYSATGLPPGLQLASATGAITGYPTQAGAYNVQITASNGALPDATASYAISIAPAVVGAGVAPVPTLSQWGVMLLALVLGWAGMRRQRD